MVCGDCGGENRKNARFCSWCGVRLALRCAVCATDIVPGAEFCDACGTPVGEPADAPAPLGARKVVTVIFADLAGSTAQHERMDPESVRGFMDAYYAAIRTAVEDEGGRVVKLMGDGVMAAFGVPRVSEDDATRAVRAGAAMQTAFAGLADRALQQFGTPVGLRVGINTGEVVVAAGDNDVVGDAVNVAARLQTAAGLGEVIVGESTWRLARDAVTLEPLPPLEVKGKAEPVRAFRLLSLDAPEVVTAGGTMFVGRDVELSRLVTLFDETIQSGATRVATVIGSPGVGKSRLSRELAAALQPRATVLEAGCPPAGGTTFGPIIDLLRNVGDAESLVAGLSGGVPASPEQVFAAVRRVFTTLATEQPLVVVIDDIQWAEPMLLDLIEHLAEWGRDAPVLLVTLARPELRDIRPTLAESGRRVAVVIVLEGLGGEASQQLARDLLGAGDLPAAMAGKLLAVTEGNPLFLRELVRMLVDDGVLIRSGDGWTTSVDAADLEVPPTVHALLSARIERLDADERLVLERAAVIGPQFPRGGVAAIAPSTLGDDLDRHLETLRRRELVEPEGTYWGDEPLYRFHHVLIRDAAYRGLLREARADLHERYADWLETTAGDAAVEQAEVLGFHLERAHAERQQLTGEPFAELGTRAAQWLVIAGRRALERDDVGAAAGLLGRALDRVAVDDPDRSSLLIDRAEAVLAAGDVVTGTACITVLRTLAGGDRRLEAWADCFDGQLANLTDPRRLHEVVRSVEEAADVLTSLDDHAGAAKAHGVRAQSLARLGRIADCEAALDKALAAARQAGDLRRANSVLAGAPLAALWGPSPVARASGKCLDVVRVLRITSGSPAVEATALRCQAVLEALRGRDDAARRMLAAARASLEELGLRSGLLETDLFAGIIDLLADRPGDAEAHLRRAYDGFRDLGVDVDAAQTAALLARSLLAVGRDDDAFALTEESEAHGGEDLKTAIAWRSARAEALARRGDIDHALQLARHAVTLAEPTDLVVDHADACRALATVLRLAGRVEEAAEQQRRAAELYERKGATAAADAGAPAGAAPSEPRPIQGARTVVPLNRASLAFRQLERLAEEHRWAEVGAMVSDAPVMRDATIEVAVRDPAQWIEALKYAYALPVDTDIVLIATRGERLSLDHVRWRGTRPQTGAFELEKFVLTELDADGRITAGMMFDDAASALVELDTRFPSGEGAEVAEEFAAIRRWIELYNERNWESYREVWADGFRVVDHRPAGWGDVDGDAYVAVLQGMVDLAPDIGATILTAEVAPGRGRTLIKAAGTSVTGGPVEIHLEMAYEIRNGRLSRVDIQAPEVHAGLRTRRLWNTAAATMEAVRRAGTEGRWGDVAALHVSEARFEDRRRGLNTVVEGRDGMVAEARFVYAHATFENEVLATRGDRCVLARTSWSGDAEGELLSLHEVNEHGSITLRLRFDVADRDAAFDALDAEYEKLEPSYTAMRRFNRAVNERDWVGLASVFAEDFVLIDRPTAGSAPMNRDQSVDNYRAIVELAPDMRVRLVSTLAFNEQGGVGVAAFEGPGLAGGATDFGVVGLAMVRDDQLTRFEIFDRDDADAALRRFEELTARATPIIVNQATRVEDAHEAAVVAGDWEDADAMLSPDIVMDDRRQAVLHTTVGKDEVCRELRGIFAALDDLQREVIALRGERLELRRCSWRGTATYDSPVEVSFLQLTELDAGGRIVRWIAFDIDDVDAAMRELDERYLAGEGDNPATQARFATARAIQEQRWDDLAALLTEDFVQVDHTPVGTGTTTKDEFIAMQRHMADLAPDISFDIAWHYRDEPGGTVSLYRRTGTRLGGGESEMTSVFVSINDHDQRLARVERYSPDQLDAALARFEELTSPKTESKLDRYVRSLDDASEVVATRGDGLALLRARRVNGDVLSVVELDSDGRAVRTAAFDETDLDAAYDELDERYIAGEGAPYATIVRQGAKFLRAFNRRDSEGMQALLAPDFAHVTLERASVTGPLDPVTLLDFYSSSTAHSAAVAIHRVHQRALLADIRVEDDDLAGGALVRRWLCLVVSNGDRLMRLEDFGDDLDAAIHRFDEVTAPTGGSRVLAPSLIENAVTRIYAPIAGPDWVQRHYDYLAAHHADDAVVEARTAAGVRYRAEGRDAGMAEGRSLSDAGLTCIDVEPLAVRGDRLALIRFVNSGEPAEHGGGPAAHHEFAVCEADDTGLICRVVIFEPHDFDDAIAELDHRDEVIHDGTHPVIDWLRKAYDSLNRGDTSRNRALMSPDFVFVDHGPYKLPPAKRDEFVRLQNEFFARPDTRTYVAAILELRPNAALYIAGTRAQGLTAEGATETTYPVITIVRDSVAIRTESFGDDMREAGARFDELTQSSVSNRSPFDLGNATLQRAISAGDLAAIDACFDAAFTGSDHTSRQDVDRAVYIATTQRMARMPGLQLRINPVARLGRRHGVLRVDYSYPAGSSSGPWADVGGGHNALLMAERFTETGTLRRADNFADNDLLGALERAEELYINDEARGAVRAASGTRLRVLRAMAAYNRGDWAGYAEAFSPGATFVDRRPTSAPILNGREEVLGWFRAMKDLVPDGHIEPFAVHRYDDTNMVMSISGRGHDVNGGEILLEFIAWLRLNEDGIAQMEYFPPDALDAALDRATTSTPAVAAAQALSNAATQHVLAEGGIGRNASPDVRLDDRRLEARLTVSGAEAVREVRDYARGQFGGWTPAFETIAVRGERLALMRGFHREAGNAVWGGGPVESEWLQLVELGDDGLIGAVTIFDMGDRDTAVAELDRRYAED